MIGMISKLFGGNKSEKDVKKIKPVVDLINQFFNQYQSLSNDELRNKTAEFKQRIAAHLNKINTEIADKQKAAEDLPVEDINGKDVFYKEIDELKKDKDK
jgi:preprotein translocase subunit SecA